MKKLFFNLSFLFILMNFVLLTNVKSQVDSGIQTLISSTNNAPGEELSSISGDGRFIVFGSYNNLATYNPRNADKNYEVFLYDVAQRHIFQITDTKSATQNVPACTNPNPNPYYNVKVVIVNHDAVISNDGKWIAFSSNATTSTPSNPNNTNPSNFDGNTPGYSTILQQDANSELWMYQIPTVQPVNLSEGQTAPFVDLAAGTFTMATNSIASLPPSAGSCTSNAFYTSDNRSSKIDDTGSTVAFISNRDYVSLNSAPDNTNELFTYKRATGAIHQISRVPQRTINDSSSVFYPAISGDGLRVGFMSTSTNPILYMTGGSNPDFSEELYFADLNSSGGVDSFSGRKVQITNTSYTTNDYVLFNGFRNDNWMSRNGRYMIIQSKPRLELQNGGNATGYNLYIYDSENTTTNPFRKIGPATDADSVTGTNSDRRVYFSDYTSASNPDPGSIVFTSRINMRPDGTVPPSNSSEGLNPSSSRPVQVYKYPLTTSNPIFTRLSNSPLTNTQTNSICFPSNSSSRLACDMYRIVNNRLTDYKIYTLLTPYVSPYNNPGGTLTFYKGGSAIPIDSGSPFQGLMPNMLGEINFSMNALPYYQSLATNVSIKRLFSAPLQFEHTTVTIDGVSAPVRNLNYDKVDFIVPSNLTPGVKNVVVNCAGYIARGTINILQSPQPDVITDNTVMEPQPYGRAKIINVTEPNNPNIPQAEPFNVTTQTSTGIVPTKLRLFLTGVEGVDANSISIKLGSVTVPNGSISTSATADDFPGVFTFDFTVPSQLDGAGHVPVVVTTTANGLSSRPIATAPQVRFLSSQPVVTDLAVWRPGNGTWYILDNNGANPIYMQWGLSTDIPAPGDYDGDYKTDFCIFRPSEGAWYFYKTSTQVLETYVLGQSGDKPAAADYDGDGKTDIAVWRPSTGVWYIIQSRNNQAIIHTLGTSGDHLVPADYDGDGKADPAFWRNSEASFYIKGTIQNSLVQSSFGQTGDKPVIGDYDGDSKADLATWRSSDNTWRILKSSTNQISSVVWGNYSSDIAVPGDYDRDGKTDIAVWRSSGSQVGLWSIKQSQNGLTRTELWGTTGDIPVPASW